MVCCSAGRVRSSERLNWKRSFHINFCRRGLFVFCILLLRRRRTVWPLLALFHLLCQPKIQTVWDGSDVLVKRLTKRSDCVTVRSSGLYRCLRPPFVLRGSLPARRVGRWQRLQLDSDTNYPVELPPNWQRTQTAVCCSVTPPLASLSLPVSLVMNLSSFLCPAPSVSITSTLSFSL